MSFDISNNSVLQIACVIEARSFKYKAKIASVSPLAKRNDFELSGSCFLGISLENSHFYPQKLAGILEWISRRFAQCTVLVGDSIHRLTLQSVHNLQPPVAMVAALALGERFMRENQPVFDRFSTATRFRFLTCHGVQAQVGYQYFHRQLLQLYRTDARFNQSVNALPSTICAKNSICWSHQNGRGGSRFRRIIFLKSLRFLPACNNRGTRS